MWRIFSVGEPCNSKFMAVHSTRYVLFEHRHEKICLRSFRPGPTETGLFNLKRWLKEAWTVGFRKWKNWTIYVAKRKALIITAQLITTFVLAYIQKADFLMSWLIYWIHHTLHDWISIWFVLFCGGRHFSLHYFSDQTRWPILLSRPKHHADLLAKWWCYC